MNIEMISAIFEDQPSKIKSLVDQGFDVNMRSHIVMPPLHRAAMYGKVNALKMLLELGADRNLQDVDHHTALYFATKYKHSSIEKILQEN